MNYIKLREEPLKSAVREDFFSNYKYTQIGNIDFVIAKHNTERGQRSLLEETDNGSIKSILWAEAKQGTGHDIYESFVQLILTIGKERTFERHLPPKYIGAFDAEKFAFIEYHQVQQVFYQNDFNWNVTPSDHASKEFRQLHALCERLLQENAILFRYDTQAAELKEFIVRNFKTDKDVSEKISVTKNNFTFVFQKWSKEVMPTISVNWENARKSDIIGADFFLADLLSENNESIKETLSVVLRHTKYEFMKTIDEETGIFNTKSVSFSDRQKAHKEFWSGYERPPKEEYWDYIIARRDLLVPQDIRERKGSFFTPQIWVEKSQQYLARALGEGWQDEYYVWDCCAGTGNLLNGLVNWRNVFASTLDKQDVDVMKDRIADGWKMFENHVFQFDFLNDDFDKCPEELRAILDDEEKRKKLVIYINPPYAEAASKRTISGTGENKTNVAVKQKMYEKYLDKIGIAGRELFAQFFIRIYIEINGCILAEFSKLKMLQAPNFKAFREVFDARLESLFVVPAKTFDNVKGNFPIGFFIWNTKESRDASQATADTSLKNGKMSELSEPAHHFSIDADAYDENGAFLQKRTFAAVDEECTINDWIIKTRNRDDEKAIGYMSAKGADFQNNGYNYIVNDKKQLPHPRGTLVTTKNVLEIAIYLAVRHCIQQTWLNDRDQFLFPRDSWQNDVGFQSDCLIFTLFHGQNRISAEHGTNHWIPFTEEQVGCRRAFKSTFMSDFLRDFLDGRISVYKMRKTFLDDGGLFSDIDSSGNEEVKGEIPLAMPGSGEDLGGSIPSQKQEAWGASQEKIHLSDEAQSVYDTALAVWKHYHAQPGAKADASFYDIRRFFQGETNGRMNNTSDDEEYTALVADLRAKQKALAARIAEKVYEHGFLR